MLGSRPLNGLTDVQAATLLLGRATGPGVIPVQPSDCPGLTG